MQYNFLHIPEIKGKTTLLQKCHEKLCQISGNTVCGLVGGSSDLCSRDLSFDSRCAHRLTSGSPWVYTVSEDKPFFSDSFHPITLKSLYNYRLFNCSSDSIISCFNPLALELDFYSLAHHLCKM